jgi:hypothetical protein
MNKKIIAGIVSLVIITGIAFYGGMIYGKSTVPSRGQFGNGTRGTGTRGGGNGSFTAGEILSKDANSITIKMQDGSTKIALIASSTQVMKSSTGSLSDLMTGIEVTVTGTANSDGSVSAKSVQIRPVGSAPFGGARNNQ